MAAGVQAGGGRGQHEPDSRFCHSLGGSGKRESMAAAGPGAAAGSPTREGAAGPGEVRGGHSVPTLEWNRCYRMS